MEIAGYFTALLTGISLGLIGGGGSILTIPVLVYLFHIEPVLATGDSLFIVGGSSLAGAYLNYRKQLVNLKAAFYFGLSSIITVVIMRKFVVPAIPTHLFSIGSFVMTKSIAVMLLFAVVMFVAAFNMIRKETPCTAAGNDRQLHLTKALIRGVETGILTGLLGAGGGFIIIPVLLFSFHLDMKEAVGTSLLIIAMNSLFGFLGDLAHHQFNWALLLTITATSIVGMFIGDRFKAKLQGNELKKGFGWFVLVMGICIVVMKLLSNV